jgi:hypothetical protein
MQVANRSSHNDYAAASAFKRSCKEAYRAFNGNNRRLIGS